VDEIAAVILAGGQSRRMGQDKRFLEIGGRPFIERVLHVLAPIFSEILIVVAEPDPRLDVFGYPVVTDLRPGYATLGGLYTGLKTTMRRSVFAVACDMPCLNQRTIESMLANEEGVDVVMASLSTGLQPMHAIYGKACLPYLEQMMDSGDLKLQNLLQAPLLRIKRIEDDALRSIDPYLKSFLNVNTPADLEMVRKLISSRAHGNAPAN
jgi:molybdopterin-guanine dinucleotide biosynthesis protein A